VTDIKRAKINAVGQGDVEIVYSSVFQMTTHDWACGSN
jgi:hypothetical protein